MKLFILSFITILSTTFSFAQTKTSTDAQTSKLYSQYLGIKDALVASDNTTAAQHAKAFAATAAAVDYKLVSEGNLAVLIKDAQGIATAKNIKQQRSYFNSLSKNMSALAENSKLSDKIIYQQYCPMAKGYWLSNEKEIKNPYYGSKMLTCGNVAKEIK